MPRFAPRFVTGLCALAVLGAAQARAGELQSPPLTLDPSVLTMDAATQPKDWVDQAKNPTSWFSWGADERLRIEYFNNAITLNEQAAGHEWDWFRYRTRLWASISPRAEFTVNARLMWEGRHWQNPVQNDAPNDTATSKAEWDNGQIVTDTLNFKVTLAPLNTTITVGRQEIILGDGWLVLEGTPLDGSTTIFFDAVRSTTQLKDIQTTVDLMYINQYSSPDVWLPTINDTDRAIIENNERGAIVSVTNKSIKDLELNPYFIYKHDEAAYARARGGDNADIYTFGTRAVATFSPNLTGRLEAAAQIGEKNGNPLCAWGLNSRLAYTFNDPMKNELRLSFEYLSGDNPGTGRDEAFDPLWGRWPQFSELYVYTYAKETRIANTTNLLRIGPSYVVRPMSGMEVELRYNALFANQNTRDGSAGFTSTGNFRGHLFSAILRHKFNRHVATHLWTEYLVPGNYYDDSMRDNAVFIRGEVALTF